jgi:hypothetical protein
MNSIADSLIGFEPEEENDDAVSAVDASPLAPKV